MGRKRSSEKSVSYKITPGVWRIRDIPERMRPREELDRLGAEHVSDDVLLAILLRSGTSGVNVVELARALLKRYGSLTGLAAASVDELAGMKGMGKVKAQVVISALELACRLSNEAAPKKFKVKSPEDAVLLLKDRARVLDNEIFWVLNLDVKNYLKGRPIEVTRGLLDASLVHPREVFREAIRSSAAGVVLVHNHPSGDVTPSREDITITRQLIQSGKVVDIKVLDHIVISGGSRSGGREFMSMRESALVSFD